MGRDGLLIGEIARRSGASRKALRLYEQAGILPRPSRTSSGYRLYDSEALALLAFIRRAQRLTDLTEVRDGLRALLKGWRSSRGGIATVCPHRTHQSSEEGTAIP